LILPIIEFKSIKTLLKLSIWLINTGGNLESTDVH